MCQNGVNKSQSLPVRRVFLMPVPFAVRRVGWLRYGPTLCPQGSHPLSSSNPNPQLSVSWHLVPNSPSHDERNPPSVCQSLSTQDYRQRLRSEELQDSMWFAREAGGNAQASSQCSQDYLRSSFGPPSPRPQRQKSEVKSSEGLSMIGCICGGP